MENENGGLFAFELSSEDEGATEKKLPRDFQSEEAFLQIKADYKPKIEAGELWKTVRLPTDNPSKPECQTILHAIEELYFFRRYDEALNITNNAMQGKLSEEYRKTLVDYQTRCRAKMSH